MKKNLITIVIGAMLVIIFALLLFVFQVRQSEVAVVTTFGKPVQNITEPGAYFKWPWPIQNVYKFDKRVQNFEDKFSENLTADNNNLLTSVYVGWKISDAKSFFPKFAGGSVPAAQRMLESMLRSAKIAVIGAGFSGTLLSLLLQSLCPAGTRIVLIERSGPGVDWQRFDPPMRMRQQTASR